ncbi:acyl-CoA dehydrogenase [Lacibacter luteus]|uniref:Acyl-CoA dehydrogenase n=1 Tax=Lacibacter luteus TaxID=2508719 RepID=A0A4Q1CG22_9BACT|nr:acyl-CoA dehydrogenase [Lacibacter luteus]RXK58857.1 acyl-CoA dehydrogenase [Lacibacter luteus]
MQLQLNKKEIAGLKRLCALAEQQAALTPALLKIIYKKKWFKLFIPKEQGGLALSLPDALRLEEQLAYIDGSLGWTVTLCAGANFFAGFLDKEKTGKLFHAKNVCLGGSGAATGIATQTKDGYTITGKWKYATGAPHLTHFTANCIIEKNGKTVLHKDGTVMIRSFYFKKSEVKLYNDWEAMGLRATASRSFSVKKIKLKEERSFLIDHAHVTLNDLVYTYPFMPFAETTLAVNTLGMARHFMDEAIAIIKQKQQKAGNASLQVAMDAVQKAQREIATVATAFYTIADASWQELSEQKKLSGKTTKQISKVSRQLVKLCRTHVAAIYPYCGLSATSQQSEINRVFRDVFTASQHALLTFGE